MPRKAIHFLIIFAYLGHKYLCRPVVCGYGWFGLKKMSIMLSGQGKRQGVFLFSFLYIVWSFCSYFPVLSKGVLFFSHFSNSKGQFLLILLFIQT